MKVIQQLILIAALALLLTACDRGDRIEIVPGSEVRIEKQDGVEIRGMLVEVGDDEVIVDASGAKTRVAKREIRTIATTPFAGSPVPDEPQAVGTSGSADPARRGPRARLFTTGPEYREVTVPADTLLPAALQSAVESDRATGEDGVRATLRRPVVVNGLEVLPAGTALYGNVVDAQRSGRIKGRAAVALRFNGIDTPEGGRATIVTAPITRVAPATTKRDAATIGAGAAGGAIVGGLMGGGEGAVKGAAVGGAAGTGVVLSRRGQEVRLATGAPLSVRLTQPLKLRVAVARSEPGGRR